MRAARPARATVTTLAALSLATGLTLAPVVAQAEEATPAPTNIIVLIGDGMGYNHVDIASLYDYGTTFNQVTVDPETGLKIHEPGTPSQVYEHFPVQLGMSHHSANSTPYDPQPAWADFTWVAGSATDSAAAGTALATGVKTNNGILGLDPDGNPLINLVEYAHEAGKATGVVSSVTFSHATPSAYVVHNGNRNDLHGIANEMIESDIDVIIGTGHPFYDDAAQPRSPFYEWISAADFARVSSGQTDFTYIESNADFAALAEGDDVPEKVFGLARVATTLQANRPGDSEGGLPWEIERNNVVDLDVMTRGALNVLSQREQGFFVMIEGGAIDWTGHANQTTRTIEEQQDFNAAIEEVVDWVESESSWEETLVIVTADHETGYLAGDGAGPDVGWTPMTGEQGELPHVSWHSGNHTNALVPFYAKGAGSELFAARAVHFDPVRGAYLDNTSVGNATFDLIELATGEPGEGEVPLQATVPLPAAGDLRLSIEDFGDVVAFSDAQIGPDRLALAADLPQVSVTDTRSDAQAQGSGWSVSGQSSDLTAANRVIGAGHLGWSPALVSGHDEVEPGPEVPTLLSEGPGLATVATLGSAVGEARLGTSVLGADLLLELELASEPGTYGGSLAVSLFPLD